MQTRHTKKIFAGIAALIGWFAIIAQLVLIIQNRVVDIPLTLLRFFSFFTILTNIIVAVCFTRIALGNDLKTGFWYKTATQTAIAVYILVVGIIYNAVLRFLWEPTGMQRVVDELLHLIIPILFLIYRIVFTDKNKLEWKQAFPWLWYPFFYLVFIMVAGSFTDNYPYPFVDVGRYGYSQVMLNCFYVLLLFLLLSFIFIAISRYSQRNKSN